MFNILSINPFTLSGPGKACAAGLSLDPDLDPGRSTWDDHFISTVDTGYSPVTVLV